MERLQTALTIFFLGFSLLTAFTGISTDDFGGYPNLLWIQDVIFLNALHATFVFVLCLTVPEFKAWTRESTNGRPYYFWLSLLLIFVSIYVVFYPIGLTTLLTKTPNSWEFVLLTAMIFIPNLHSLWQVKGISLAYNRTCQPAPSRDGKRTFQQIEKTERLLFTVLLYCCFSFLNILFKVTGDHYVLFGMPRLTEYLAVLPNYVTAAAVVVILLLLWNSLDYPEEIRYKKVRFLTRLFLIPLMAISPFAGVFISCYHGIEYLLVSSRMIKASSASQDEKTKIRTTMFVVAVVYGVAYMATAEVDPLNIKDLPFTHALKTLLLTFAYTHYYADRVFFRMRNPITRKRIGQLLWGA